MRSKQGFNLIEAAIVLGVLGLVIAGIWIAAASVRNSYNENLLVQQLGQAAANIRAVYKSNLPSASTSMDSSSGLKRLVYPADMFLGSAASAGTPWNTRVAAVVLVNDPAPGDNAIAITFGVDLRSPVSSCISLAAKIRGTFRGNELPSGSIPLLKTNSGNYPLMTFADANSYCQTEYDEQGLVELVLTLSL